MSYATRVEDPAAFAEKHNSQLTEETERQLRLASRNAWLEQICRKVAHRSLMAAEFGTGRAVEVRLPGQ